MRVVFHVLFIFIYSLLDIFLTFASLTLYSNKWSIDFENILKIFNFFNYSYWTSPLDFVILAGFRQLVLFITFLLVRFGKSAKLKEHVLLVDIAAVISYILSVIKLLAFDENSEFLNNSPGAFINVGCSIVFSFLLCVLVRVSILSSQFDYQRLEENEATENNEENGARSSTDSAEGDDDDDKDGVSKEEEASRLPLWKHVFLIVKICSKQWKWFLLSYGLLLASCALDLIEPALYSRMLTDAITMKSFDVLKRACYLLAVVQIGAAITGTAKDTFMSYAENKTTKQIRIALFKAILHQDISFFDENKTGQLMSRITHDSDSISNSLPGYIETTTTNLINFFGALPIMFFYSWQLSITAFITFPISMILTKIYALYIEKLAEKANDATAVSNETVQEVLAAIRTVRSFGTERIEYGRYTRNTDDWFKISLKSIMASTTFGFIWYFMWNIEDVLVYLYGGYLTINGRMASESLLSYVFYHWRLHSALNSFTSMFSDLMKTIGSSRKVIYLLNRKPVLDYENGTEKPEVMGRIVFDGVEFAYPTRKNVDVLKGLTLTIEKGKTIALVGPSGNGKTTIVSLIEQFYAPRSGQVLLDGTNIQNIDHEYYHSKIALVAQEPTLFSGSIRENILYGIENENTNEREEEMLRVAKMANVHEFVEKLEKGYDTKCGEKGVQMSGGQKQRIAIARALIRNPVVLILDEATSALDAESESLVQEALNNCAKDRTVIVIAHRLSTVKSADKIAVIEKGEVTEMGTHTELMQNSDGMYYKLVSKQLEPKKEEKKNDDEIF